MLNPRSRRSLIPCCLTTGQKQSPITGVARRRTFRNPMAVAASGFFGCLFVLSGAICQGQSVGGPVVTPATGAVFQGQSVTLTSQKPVNWTLVNGSYGTLTVNSPTSATFTAPATAVTPNNVVAGCQTAPNDTLWNTRVDNLPLDPNSATWITTLGGASSNLTYSLDFGTNVANSRTATTNEYFTYTPQNDGWFVTPQWPNLKRQMGVFTSTQTGDHHIFTVNTDSCYFYELYQTFLTPRACGTETCTAESGVKYSWSSYALPINGSTDAAALLYAPTMLHLSEINAGAVNHVLKFVLGRDLIRGAQYAAPYWPSLSGNSAPYGRSLADLPYGARLRLTKDFVISGFSPDAQVILTALKQYGMILSDATNPGFVGPQIVANTDVAEDATAKAALDEIVRANIPASDFEAVDESSFIVSQQSSEVNPANGYETPNGYSVVTATDASNPNSTTTVPIAVESNFPSVSSPTLYIVAGSSPYTLTSGVRASHYDGSTWNLVSGVGSISAGGAYTPPATVSAPTTAVLKVALNDIPEQYSNVYVTVIPKSSDNNLRIDVGSPTATQDKEPIPFTWLADQAFENGTYVTGGDYPSWSTSSPERLIYQTWGHTYGDDMVYTLAMSNGNYMVRLMFGQPYAGHTGTFPSDWHAPINLEANGQIAAHNYDFGIPINHQYATPVDNIIPATVTNGLLTVALRANVPAALATKDYPVVPAPELNGIEVIPDNSAPHIAIDAQQATSVPAGSTLQLYSVGWYMSNAVTWSIASGPGTIDQSGLYTAPGSQSSQPVTIQATSTVNSKLTATVTLTIPAGS